MLPSPVPLIQPNDDPNNNNDPILQSSPPPINPHVVHEASVSSPQGVPPIPVASSSPIPTNNTRSSFQSQPILSPTIPNTTVLQQSQDVPSISKTINSILTSCQEDLDTPRAKEQKEMEVTKPEKKKSTKVTASSEVSRRLAFSTKPKSRQSKTRRAGLVMSVSRVLGRLKAGRYSRRVGVTGGVYLAAVLEYLVAEVLELAGNCARFFRKKRVFPRCIQLALLHDKELDQLTRGVIVPQGGVRPYIHPALLGKTKMVTDAGGADVEDQVTKRSYLDEEVGTEGDV